MTQNRRFDPSIKSGKIKLEPIEWEKFAILDKPREEHREQSKKKRKMRRSKYARNNRIDRKRLLEIFEREYSSLKWNLFGTLSFDRKDLELWRAKRAFDEWIYEMIVDDAADIFRRLRIIEHRAGESCRFHFFVRSPHFTSKYILMARWKTFVSGEADLWYITRAGANKRYLEDAALPTSEFEIDDHEF